VHFARLDVFAERETEEHGAHGLAVLLVRPSDPGGREPDVGAEQLAHPGRHRACGGVTHDRRLGHVQQRELDLARIGDERAPQHVAGARHGAEAGRREATAHRFG
jgi:hypothetical protein